MTKLEMVQEIARQVKVYIDRNYTLEEQQKKNKELVILMHSKMLQYKLKCKIRYGYCKEDLHYYLIYEEKDNTYYIDIMADAYNEKLKIQNPQVFILKNDLPRWLTDHPVIPKGKRIINGGRE